MAARLTNDLKKHKNNAAYSETEEMHELVKHK